MTPKTPPRPRGPAAPAQMKWLHDPEWSYQHRVDTATGRILCTGDRVRVEDLEEAPDVRQCNDCLSAKGRSAL